MKLFAYPEEFVSCVCRCCRSHDGSHVGDSLDDVGGNLEPLAALRNRFCREGGRHLERFSRIDQFDGTHISLVLAASLRHPVDCATGDALYGAQQTILAVVEPTGSISSALTSTATLRMIVSRERTTRRSFFLRTNTPSTPPITPAMMRTLSPTTRYGCGSILRSRRPERNASISKSGRGQDSFDEPTIDSTPGVPRTTPRACRAMRTKT